MIERTRGSLLRIQQEGVVMEEAWREFEGSGKVTDYLNFCAVRKEREERPDGTECDHDRNGLKCNADWRVR